jgi:hypothetical protein
MSTSSAVTCPLCGDPINEEVSYDHVFGDKFGGKFEVATHKKCNNDLGDTAEGALHRGYSLLNFVKIGNDLPGQAMPATTISGREVTVDLTTHMVEPRAPIVERDPTTGAVVRITGNERQLAPILKNLREKQNPAIPEFADLTEDDYEIVTEPDNTVTLNLRFDFAAAERVGAKAALGAGVKAFGEDFATTPLASELRKVLNGDVDSTKPVSPDLADAVDVEMAPFVEELSVRGKSAPPTLAVPGYTNDCVFIPTDDSTSVLVKIGGFTALARNLPARLPDRGDGGPRDLPVVVRDDPLHERSIVDYTDALTQLGDG